MTDKKQKYYVKNKDLYNEIVSFNKTGKCSNRLGHFITILVEKYAQHPWFSGYTYNDEMQANARLKIFEKLDKFNIHKYYYLLSEDEWNKDKELIVKETSNRIKPVAGDNILVETLLSPDEEETIGLRVTFSSDMYIDEIKNILGNDVKPRYSNVHAYFTQIARNEFQKYKKFELKQQTIRDEILMSNDMEVSYNHVSENIHDELHGDCVSKLDGDDNGIFKFD